MPKKDSMFRKIKGKIGPKRFSRWTFWGAGHGKGTLKRVMSNKDRRKMGLEQDKDQPDFDEEYEKKLRGTR